LARAIPAVLVAASRCARAPSRPHGSQATAPDQTAERKVVMSRRESYAPGPAAGAKVRKDADKWTLILVRDLRHPPEKVWRALTTPAELREWAPFDADRDLGAVGPVRLATVGTPTPQVSESNVTRAEAPRLLEYSWGGNDMRWELEPTAGGTRLTLW